MGAGPAGRAEILIERVLRQRMRETPTAGNIRDLAYQRGCRGGVEEIEQIVGAELGDRVEELEVEVATDHRGDGEHLVRAFAESRDTGADYLSHAVGEQHLRQVSRRRPAPGVVLCDSASLG